MKKNKLFLMMGLLIFANACSVQQFSINTKTEPFERGGRIWGERTKKHEKNNDELKVKKSGDLHILGINLKKSNTKRMAEELGAESYTIETKSNIFFILLTGGILDYKIVKVIKRED